MNMRAVMWTVWIFQVWLPLTWTLEFLDSTAKSRVEWMADGSWRGVALVLLFLVGRWDLFWRPLRYIYLPLFLTATAVSWERHVQDLPWAASPGQTHWPGLLLGAGLGLLFLVMATRAASGRRVSAGAVYLTLPLRSGRYAVVHGGSTRAVNYHGAHRAQRYALDIVKVNRLGLRARSFYPADLTRYFIFGDVVYSPCDGDVMSAEDRHPDLPAGETNTHYPAGNHVLLLREDGVKVLLAHLRSGSVLVRSGQRVTTGQALGVIGNSGNTSEPHLHVHAERGGSPQAWGDGTGVPILFDGRFLCRNDIVTPAWEYVADEPAHTKTAGA